MKSLSSSPTVRKPNGFLNILKPGGKTSYQVVAEVKKATKTQHLGHAGTLDKEASGVLPVAIGEATRLIEFLHEKTKLYRAEIELGVETDTYDLTGRVLYTSDTSNVSLKEIREALLFIKGENWQRPPIYSALKYNGAKFADLARRGVIIMPPKRLAQIYDIAIINFEPPHLTIEVECGKGTYIRSLAHDLGEKLGCGACLKKLERLKYGPFDINHAITIDELKSLGSDDHFYGLLYPLDIVIDDWPAIIVDKEKEIAIRQGKPVDLPVDGPRCRAYSQDGCLTAILMRNKDDRWSPKKVFCLDRNDG